MSSDILVEDGKVETSLKCPYCECLFSYQSDRSLHLPVCSKSPANRSQNMWHPSKNGGPEQWAFTSDDPQLKLALQQHGGKLCMGGWTVTLSSEKYFRRVPMNE